jgi:nitronate monooxygenase
VFDVGWENAPHRVLRSSIAAVLVVDGPDPVGHVGSSSLVRRSPTPPNRATTGDIGAMALYAGRSVGALTRRSSAAAIIEELMAGTAGH